MVVKLVPVPVAGIPAVAVQVKVTGAVPPLDVAVQVTGLPTVPVVGHVAVTVNGTPKLITIVADAVAVFAFPSVTVTLTV